MFIHTKEKDNDHIFVNGIKLPSKIHRNRYVIESSIDKNIVQYSYTDNTIIHYNGKQPNFHLRVNCNLKTLEVWSDKNPTLHLGRLWEEQELRLRVTFTSNEICEKDLKYFLDRVSWCEDYRPMIRNFGCLSSLKLSKSSKYLQLDENEDYMIYYGNFFQFNRLYDNTEVVEYNDIYIESSFFDRSTLHFKKDGTEYKFQINRKIPIKLHEIEDIIQNNELFVIGEKFQKMNLLVDYKSYYSGKDITIPCKTFTHQNIKYFPFVLEKNLKIKDTDHIILVKEENEMYPVSFLLDTGFIFMRKNVELTELFVICPYSIGGVKKLTSDDQIHLPLLSSEIIDFPKLIDTYNSQYTEVNGFKVPKSIILYEANRTNKERVEAIIQNNVVSYESKTNGLILIIDTKSGELTIAKGKASCTWYLNSPFMIEFDDDNWIHEDNLLNFLDMFYADD
jgi:hypothetical protein